MREHHAVATAVDDRVELAGVQISPHPLEVVTLRLTTGHSVAASSR
jgi:hypothetical protein